MNDKHKYGILVAVDDKQYTSYLINILHDIFLLHDEHRFEISHCSYTTELVEFASKNIDLAIIDHSLLIEDGKKLMKTFETQHPACLNVLLVSDQGGEHIKDFLQDSEEKENHLFEDMILKDNYPYKVVFMILHKQVEKIIKNNN